LLDVLKIQNADVLGFSMGSLIAQKLALSHPDKFNRLVLYGASCGGEQNIPQIPQIVKILSDLVNNRTQDSEKTVSTQIPLNWVRPHPNVTLPKSTEIVTSNVLRQ